MFSSASNSKKSKETASEDHYPFVILAAGAGIVLTLKKHSSRLENYYFHNYEEIYLSAWLIFLAILAFGIYRLNKKTKDMDKRKELLAPLWSYAKDKVRVGNTDDGINLYVTDKERCTHVQVIGTTGRGKTQSVVIPWTMRDLGRGKSVILLDGKGSLELPIELKENVAYWGLNTRILNFELDRDDGIILNPLKNGTAQQITDRLFSVFEFNDPFYKATQYDICGTLIRLLHALDEVTTFRKIYDLLEDDKVLSTKVKSLPESELELKGKLIRYLKTPFRDRKKDSAGLTSQLSPLAVGEVSKLLNGGDNEVVISDLLSSSPETPYLLILSIPTLKYQKIGHQIGKVILQEIAFSIGERERSGKDHDFTSVFLDEFSEFVYEDFVSILNKARSTNVAFHLCHQSMGDLNMVSKDFALSVNTNTNIKCILGLNDPDTAEFFARHFGTKKKKKYTEAVETQGYFKSREQTGKGSMRDVESYKIHPNTLKSLYQGRGVLHLPTKQGVVTELLQYHLTGLGDYLEVYDKR